jgi:hypothetical protein
MSDDAVKVQELDAEIAGQKLKLVGGNLGTLLAVFTFIVCSMVGYMLYGHTADAKEAQSSFVAAVKELTAVQREGTAAAREQNCLISIREAEREAKAEFCKRITR